MEITHFFGGGVYVKETKFKAGEFGEKHIHDYDHLSTLVSGTAGLQIDQEVQILEGPAVIVVKAGKAHKVTAITDVVWHCTHATDCTDADHIDEVLTRRD